MTQEQPEWRKAWKTDDPDWLKDRQLQWKKLKSSPVFKGHFTKEQLSQIKTFFLYGRAYDPEPEPEDWRWLRYHPNKRPIAVSHSALLQCWLAPEYNPERWSEIKALIDQSSFEMCRPFFRDKLRYEYPVSGSLFGDREKLLYHYFGPTRCRLQDFEGIEDVYGLNITAARSYMQLSPVVELFLNSEYNAASIAPELLPELCDTFVPYSLHNETKRFRVEKAQKILDFIAKPIDILSNPSDYHPEQVKASQYIIDRLNAEDLVAPMDIIRNAIDKAGFGT